MSTTAGSFGMALDCECGTTVAADDDDELLDELLDHIAASHDAERRREPVAMIVETYER